MPEARAGGAVRLSSEVRLKDFQYGFLLFIIHVFPGFARYGVKGFINTILNDPVDPTIDDILHARKGKDLVYGDVTDIETIDISLSLSSMIWVNTARAKATGMLFRPLVTCPLIDVGSP